MAIRKQKKTTTTEQSTTKASSIAQTIATTFSIYFKGTYFDDWSNKLVFPHFDRHNPHSIIFAGENLHNTYQWPILSCQPILNYKYYIPSFMFGTTARHFHLECNMDNHFSIHRPKNALQFFEHAANVF